MGAAPLLRRRVRACGRHGRTAGRLCGGGVLRGRDDPCICSPLARTERPHPGGWRVAGRASSTPAPPPRAGAHRGARGRVAGSGRSLSTRFGRLAMGWRRSGPGRALGVRRIVGAWALRPLPR
ncbi:MAG: hypothetical protein E6K76_12435 [Candidatus Eisenbacteria bacterium]|uniref:Uncharacterized protein n=1 Tax=Eiseniibacteriota bacterium TaxID=2212470 RepID=A0A538SYY0_UNCEI|nr:MAG: hypothetical protein E6K76_12435 [Candidatus Eisenbacteria bacterium]